MSGWTEEQVAAHNARVMGTQPEVAKPVAVKIPRPKQNKWEQAYDAELRVKWGAGVIQWYGFEAIKLRLANGTHYTPDFALIDERGTLQFHEVKGHWRDDALVKFKVAAEKFPFLFIALRKQRVSEGGEWEVIRWIDGGAK